MSSGGRDDEKTTKLETFSGVTQEYKRWRRRAELHLLGLPTTVGKTKWGPRLLEALSGEAWELLESIPIKDIIAEDGYELVFKTLDGKYAERAQDELQRALREFFYTVVIKPGEEFRAFIVRLETSYRLLVSHEVELPVEVRGWFLLKKLCLDQTQEAMVLTATQGKLDYKSVTDAIRAVFPHGKGQPSKSRDSKDVFEVDEDEGMSFETKGVESHDEVFEVWQGIAEQIQEQGSDYDSEEVLEVFESYKDIKRRVQDRKIGRGYQPLPEKWNITGNIKAKVEAIKAKTRCFVCKKLGHWKKECPEKRRRKDESGRGKKEVNDVNYSELTIPENLDAFILEYGAKDEEKKQMPECPKDQEKVEPFCRYVTKVHKKFRRALYVPGGDLELKGSELTGARCTHVQFMNGSETVISDNFHEQNGRMLSQKWKGTTFLETVNSQASQGSGARQVTARKHLFLDEATIDAFEAHVLGGGGPDFESSPTATASVSDHAVPDTACRRTLIGQYTLHDMERHVLRTGLRVVRRSEVNSFRFGNSGELTSTEVASIPVCIGGKHVAIHAAVLPGSGSNTPLLLSKELMKMFGCVLDMNGDEMMFQRLGTKVKLHVTDRGHYAIPLFEPSSRSSRGPRVDHNVCLIGEDAEQATGPEPQLFRVQHEPLGQAPDGESRHRGQCGLQQAGQLGCLERPSPRGRAVGLSSQRPDSPDGGEVRSQAARPHSGVRDLHERQGLCEMDPRSHRGGSPDFQVHEGR